MAWIEPKTDWNSNDEYNCIDLNRVDNNTQFLNDFISEFNSQAILESYSSKSVSDYPRAGLINLVESNIKAVRDAFIPYINLTFKTDWMGGKNDIAFDYNHANRLESNLVEIKTNAENIKSGLRYCGTFYSGGDLGL